MTSRRRLRGPPPGYAAIPRPIGAVATALELFVPSASLLLALDQLLVVQPDLYLHTGAGPSKLLVRLVLLGCGVAGWLGAMRATCASAMLLASLGVAASGPVQFWAFGHGSMLAFAAMLPSAVGLLGIGGAIRRVPKCLLGRIDGEGVTHVLLRPFVAFGILAGLCMGAVFANSLGPIRSSLAIAGGLAAAASLSTVDHKKPLVQLSGSATAVTRWFGYTLLVAYAICAYLTERVLPLRRVLTSSHPIVFLAESERCTLAVTSGQGAYHLFVDDELRFSTFDEKRWAESLVKPALARVRQPKRALVLSTGEGLIERELLKDPGILSITSVVRCRLVPETARRSAWIRRLTGDAMNSPRVSLVERDPAAYLTSTIRQTYDLVIADLPDPAGPQQSKYYSRYFYQQLAARMRGSSILVVQSTSARRSPRTFATIGATMRAAGLSVQPLIVPLVSRGEWSLYLSAKGPIPHPARPEWLANSLASTIPEQFSHPWPDTMPPPEFVAEPSTLHDAKVLEWFAHESGNESESKGESG